MKTAALVAATFVAFAHGCNETAMPPNDATVVADLACETARMVTVLSGKIPPTPAPASDTCPRCQGKGVIGDGASIRMTCPDCGGTGKKPKSVLKACPTGACQP
jgi:DnaJ-class molecular chaperone